MATTKGRRRGFDRDTALERAITAFWQHGYEATSIAELTRVMGINPPSLYAAFGDKRTLFTEAVNRYQQTHGAFTGKALSEEPTARRGIERLLREAAVAYTAPSHPPGCLVITAATNCGPDSTDIQAELREVRAAGKRALEQKIDDDIRAGELPADTDAHALAAFYAAIVQGMSTQARDGAGRDELDQVVTLALRAWPPQAAARTPAP